MSEGKHLEIIAGPNGSGKTTFAQSYLLGARKKTVFLNPDLIASGIAPGDFEKASFQAGRVLIREINTRLGRDESFAFESTLSGLTWANLLKRARQQNYRVSIYFLFLKKVEQNLERIRVRVSMGGHNIPKASVLRRQARCFQNFWNVYRPLADEWFIFDNSANKPRLILSDSQFSSLEDGQKANFANAFQKGRPRERKA